MRYQVTICDDDGAEHEFVMESDPDDPLLMQQIGLETVERGIRFASVVSVEYLEEEHAKIH
jgi:hypothetical protein